MGRRELRSEIQSTWVTYEHEPGTPRIPFRKQDLVDADERHTRAVPPRPSAPHPPRPDAKAATHGGATSTTTTLTSAEDVAHFDSSGSVDILSLPEADARAILGDPVYESAMSGRDGPSRAGALTVTAIDRGAAGVTFENENNWAKEPR